MEHLQISFTINKKFVDYISDILFEEKALSITISDSDNGTCLENPIFAEPIAINSDYWENCKLTTLFSKNVNINKIIATCKLLIPDLEYSQTIIPNTNWISLSQKDNLPITITKHFSIIPSWHKNKINTNKYLILDPEQAFGSGSHPTTFMCLKWLATNNINKYNILDYGCGSGILALSACILDANKAVGVDLDKNAIITSKNNSLINNVKNAKFYLPKIFKNLKNKKFDVVIANILATPLIELSEELITYTNNTLLLSGILKSQAREVISTYNRYFNNCEIISELNDWLLIICKNN